MKSQHFSSSDLLNPVRLLLRVQKVPEHRIDAKVQTYRNQLHTGVLRLEQTKLCSDIVFSAMAAEKNQEKARKNGLPNCRRDPLAGLSAPRPFQMSHLLRNTPSLLTLRHIASAGGVSQSISRSAMTQVQPQWSASEHGERLAVIHEAAEELENVEHGLSRRPFSAAFSAVFSAAFLGSFVSSFSQLPSSAIILLWSRVGGQLLTSSPCGQGLVVSY